MAVNTIKSKKKTPEEIISGQSIPPNILLNKLSTTLTPQTQPNPPKKVYPKDAGVPVPNTTGLLIEKDGKTYLGANKEEYNNYIASQNNPFDIAMKQSEELKKEELRQALRQEALKPLLNKIGQITPEEQTALQTQLTQPLSDKKSLLENIGTLLQGGSMLPNATPITFPLPITGAGGVGFSPMDLTAPTISKATATKTIWSKILTNKKLLTAGGLTSLYKLNQRQGVKEQATIFSTSVSNLNEIKNAVNKGEISPDDAIIMWNEELKNINEAERKLIETTNGNLGLNAFLSGGKDELVKIESFNRVDKFLMRRQFEQAILNPNPDNISYINTLPEEAPLINI